MLNQSEAENLISNLYKYVLRREPKTAEFESWTKRARDDLAPATVVEMFHHSIEGKAKNAVKPAFPDGHFYSPVVDPRTVKDYFDGQHRQTYKDFDGIPIDPAAMLRFWDDNLPAIQSTPFTEQPSPENRFHYEGTPYPYGDAIILRAMIGAVRPKRIIEVGSGYSSACMLDSADHFGLDTLDLTCIDPSTERLRRFLRPADEARVKIMECPVQTVPLEVFSKLDAGDILFIDSTHVLKTGSDVHYELFSVLPSLKKGVLIHFHDTPYPFEYERRWVFEINYSWNEAYALRAFLMYNAKFRIYFWNSLLRFVYPERIEATCPIYLKNPGSGIWLKKTA